MAEYDIPRAEYPRPDFERDHWQNLNGRWGFAFDDDNRGEEEGWQGGRTEFPLKITVPFCYQSVKSGIHDTGMHPVMWYQRSFDLEESLLGMRVRLCFGAVDTNAKVWLNGVLLGSHSGGYTPFSFDVTPWVKEKDNLLIVRAEDSYECSKPRGKQYWGSDPDRCWYTPSSGIWQTVWLEGTGDLLLEQILLTPDIDRRCVEAELYLNDIRSDTEVWFSLFYGKKCIRKVSFSIDRRISKLTLPVQEEDFVDEIHYWSPEHPNLYELEIALRVRGEQTDHVRTYFGMRKISVNGADILLNNRPYYQKLVLDQGYWPESLITPPEDEAIRKDILLAKEFGFNGARKHQKAEDPRYYYWADKLGFLVWGEMPSGYAFDAEEIQNVAGEWTAFVRRDYNHPSIVAWVPLNESWGVRNIFLDKRQQAFAEALYQLTKALDPIRLVSTNDGWEQVTSDICGIHDYAGTGASFAERYREIEKLLKRDAQGRMLYAQGYAYEGQPILITEYGGIAFRHEKDDKAWGYNDPAQDEEDFLRRFADITGAIKSIPQVCGYCYTQLTDVQQEINGLLTADRKVKVDPERIREVL